MKDLNGKSVFDFDDNREPKFAEIALPVPLRQTFTYSVPAVFAHSIRVGSRVNVPFGTRFLTGYAVALHGEIPKDLDIPVEKIRAVYELLDAEPLITPEILELTKWSADYYLSAWGEILKASLPVGINASIEAHYAVNEGAEYALQSLKKSKKRDILQQIFDRKKISERELLRLSGGKSAKKQINELVKDALVSVVFEANDAAVKPKRRKAVRLISDETEKLNEQQTAVIDALKQANDEVFFTDLVEIYGVSASSIATLARRGAVEIFIKELRRDPFHNARTEIRRNFTLTGTQTSVLQEVTAEIEKQNFAVFLLHGVTGSGKTEVYIRAMQKTLALGKTALMLVPEIALTPMFSRRLRAAFGDEVAILHSNLSQGERFDEWRRIRAGTARVVIGTRSAIFAPLEKIGLLIIDEEHDASYRQHESPFYSARDLAVVRARNADAVAVLGSATPSLESYRNAKTGKFRLLKMPDRIENRPLAQAEIIDMREVFKAAGKDVTFSEQMLSAIRETHKNGEQSIILLNRRGFSQFVFCRSCGEAVRCQNCDITLTYHRRAQSLVCHYCDYREIVPDSCPECKSQYLYFVGDGTEQLEQKLIAAIPNLRISRVDRDTVARKGVLDDVLHRFADHEIDVLVGTQILAKGHDFPNVTLVGVVSVDAALSFPDFRASERVFQLLTQVAGRAGRGESPGKVLIQSYYPENYALQYASRQDYEGFFAKEIAFRQNMFYPPIGALAAITVKNEDHAYALRAAQIFRESLVSANSAQKCRILGPAPAPIARIKNEFRFQILIKAEQRNHVRELIGIATIHAEDSGCDMRTVTQEIDPIDLL